MWEYRQKSYLSLSLKSHGYSFFFTEKQRQLYGMCARTNICRAAPGSSPLPPVSTVPAALSQAEQEVATGELAKQ